MGKTDNAKSQRAQKLVFSNASVNKYLGIELNNFHKMTFIYKFGYIHDRYCRIVRNVNNPEFVVQSKVF